MNKTTKDTYETILISICIIWCLQAEFLQFNILKKLDVEEVNFCIIS